LQLFRERGVVRWGEMVMGLFTPDVNDLRTLYIDGLRKALSSERQIAEDGLPDMIEAATNPKLAQAFRTHLEETKLHIARLEEILDAEEGEADDWKCKVTAALISEAGSEAGDAKNDAVRDVSLIASGNKVEHHEIAVYGTLRTWAVLLGQNEDAAMLEQTLQEEKNADALLTELSERINVQAPVSAAA
jgi:ferritin-like metal-binding protein YciE